MRIKFVLLSLIFVFVCGFVKADDRLISKTQFARIVDTQYKLKIVGDALVGERIGKVNNSMINHQSNILSRIINTVLINNADFCFITSITYTPTSGQSLYDHQSNASAVQIWQNPFYPNQIHVVYMSAKYDDPSFDNRRCKYFYSSDRGVTWTFITDVPDSVRSGFVTVTGLSNGNALIANHSDAGGGVTRTQVYADASPGLGSFYRLDPGTGNLGLPPLWPRIIATSNITNINKFVLIASQNYGGDSAFFNIGKSISPPDTFFTGWTNQATCDAAGAYALARGDDGRIGIVYNSNEKIFVADMGDVYFIESTDHGATFSSPIKIFDADLGTSGDSLGCLRGVSIVYQHNDPKVVFETIKQYPPYYYVPLAPSKIRFWSTTLPGTDPNRSIVIADSSNVWFPRDSLYNGVNDVFAPICRPVIGRSSDYNALFSAFVVVTNRFGGTFDITNFHAIYLSTSADSGASWKTPVRITPESPVMDWVYPSITPVSDNDSNYYYVNMTIQKDTIPGSFIQGSSNGRSLAQQIFVRVKLNRDSVLVGNKSISSKVIGKYELYQNYPNPFNPKTKIRFDLQKSAYTKLIIYDLLGKEVTTLVNQKLSAGIYEVSWPAPTGDASGYPSGVYFYKLVADGFSDVKKMILLK